MYPPTPVNVFSSRTNKAQFVGQTDFLTSVPTWDWQAHVMSHFIKETHYWRYIDKIIFLLFIRTYLTCNFIVWDT